MSGRIGVFLGALAVLCFDLFATGPLWQQLLTYTYSTTTAQLEFCDLAQERGPKRTPLYGVRVRYAFQVGEQSYAGQRISYSGGATADPYWAQAYVSKHKAPTAVAVYYRTKDPGDNVLQWGWDGLDLLKLFGLAVIHGFLAFVTLGFFANPQARPRVKAQIGGLMMAALALTGLSLAACLFEAVVGGPHPSTHLMVGLWGIVLTLTVATYVRFSHFRPQPDHDDDNVIGIEAV